MLSEKVITVTRSPYTKRVTLITDTNVRPKAAVVYFHGGGLLYGSRADLPKLHKETLTRAGYAIWACDYPLAPACHLREIMEAINESIAWYCEHGAEHLGHPLPYFLWGRSAGAYLALLAGAEITEEAFSPAIVEVYQKYTADNVFQLGKYTQDLTQACLWSVVLFLIPAILVTGPVEAGIAYVCRNWARDEHAFIWGDFKDAVKDNWKQGLGISAITSVMPVIMFVCYNFYSEMSKESVVYMVPQMLVLLIGFIWWLGLVFFYPLMVSYKMTFGQLIKNGLMLGVGRLPQALGFRLLCLVPVLICAFLLFFTGIGMYGILVICVYYLICGIALTRFVYASFTNAVFDRFINSKIEGVKINRGLSEESDDDDEEPEAEKQDE